MVKCPLGCFLVYSSLLVARMRESVCTNRDFSASPSVHAEIRQGCQLSDTFRVGICDVFHCRRHKDYPHSAKGKNYVTPGDLNNSYLLDVLEHDNHIDIFNGAEQREVRALIRTWIKAGAENN